MRQDKSLTEFENLRCQNNGNLKNGRFSAKVEKVYRIALYGPAISQVDRRKADPYQLPYNGLIMIHFEKYIDTSSIVTKIRTAN